MQEHYHSYCARKAGSFKERRKDTHQRDIVARGVHAGRDNVLSGLEYLQSRGIDAHIIRRVLLRLLIRRALTKQTEQTSL